MSFDTRFDSVCARQTSSQSISRQFTNQNRTGDREVRPLQQEDIVCISDMAYQKSISNSALKSEEERTALYEQIRSELEKLSVSRRNLNGHIEAILKENGIKLGPGDKMRVETSGGKICVGGIKDKKTRKAVEEALNRENGFADKIRDMKATERKTSDILKSETGVSLHVLSKASIGKDAKEGDVMVKLMGSENLDQFSFFAQNPDLVGLIRENAELSIDFGGGQRPFADPEGTLKAGLKKAHGKIRDRFNAINDDLMEKLKTTGALKDPDFDKDFLMDLDRVTIRVGSDGGVEIDGNVANDDLTNRKGKEIITELVREMMRETDDSGELVLFVEASQRLLDDYHNEFGSEAADDAVVEMEIGRDAKSAGGSLRIASPAKEAEILGGVNTEVNAIVAGMGIETDFPFDISIGDSGKLIVNNLPEAENERDTVLRIFDVITMHVEQGDENDPRFGRLVKLLKHSDAFRWGGTAAFARGGEEENEKSPVVTPYSPKGAASGIITTEA